MKKSIKKAIAGLSVAAMLVSAMQVVSAWYNDPEYAGDFETKLYGDGVSIEKYIGASKEKIEVPNEINGEKVVCIKDYAFSNVTNDVTIYIPESVEDIRPEAIITAGSINKVVVELPGIENPTVNDLASFWAKKIPGLGSPEKIEKKVIEKAVELANEKVADIKGDINAQLNSTINDVVKDLSFDVPEVNLDDYDIDLNLDEALDIKVSDVAVDVELKGADYVTDDEGNFLKPLNKNSVEADIKKQIEDQVESEMAKIRGQIADKKAEAEKKIEDAKKKVGDAQDKLKELEEIELPDVDKMVDDIKTKINKSVDDMLGNVINDIMTTVDNYMSTAIVKAQEILKDIPIKGSVSETAVEVLKDVRGFGDGTYVDVIKTNYNKAANKTDLIPEGNIIKKMNEYLDKAIEKFPYTGISFVVETEDCEAAEFAEAHGIAYEVGEPVEPTEPVEGTTVTKIEYLPGSTYTSIVDGSTIYVTGATETNIVYVTEPKETVTSIVTSIVEVEKTVPVYETVLVTVPVYITEPKTTEPALEWEPGDVNMNGKIDLYDTIWIAEKMINKREFTDEQIKIGDVSGNGVIDLYDAIGVATKIVQNAMKG